MSRFRNALFAMRCTFWAVTGWLIELVGLDEQDDAVTLAKQEFRKRRLSEAERVRKRG